MTSKPSSSDSPAAFARVSGSPGEAPRLVGLLRVFGPLFVVVFLSGYLLRAAWPRPQLSPSQVGFALLMLAGLLAWVLVHSRQRLQNFLKGARGEEEVARILSYLPVGYSVFHGVSLAPARLMGAPGDIDHVVLGPTGVFAIETKNWSGRLSLRDGQLLLDGRTLPRSPIEQAKASAKRIEQALAAGCGFKVAVQPVVCFVSSRIEGGRRGSGGVILCGRDELLEVVREAPESVPEPEALRLAAQMLEAQVTAQRDQDVHL